MATPQLIGIRDTRQADKEDTLRRMVSPKKKKPDLISKGMLCNYGS